MRAIIAREKSAAAEDLQVSVEEVETPLPGKDECLIEVHASGVNPSDAKALLGKMPNLVWPRVPGRDYAGIVLEGPSELIGAEVWGTGGELGMQRNGNHAEMALVDTAGVRRKPANLSMEEAGSLGVSWTCAYMGMVEGAAVEAGQTVVVLGANGAVGQSAVQLATGAGASVIAVERSRDDYAGHSSQPIDVVNLSKENDLHQAIMDRTDGKGADIIMNSIGSPYFETAQTCLAKRGTQIIISTIVEEVPIDLRHFYRGNHRLVGVSNIDYDNVRSAQIMEDIGPGFEDGTYKPYAVKSDCVFGLDNATEGYQTVLENVRRDRIIIDPRR